MSDDNNELLENNEEASVEITDVSEENSPVENTEEKSSGGLFNKIKEKREARREAVGEDDTYDIFDLQEIMDITFDESDMIDPVEEIVEDFNPDITVEEVSDDAGSEHKSLFSRIKENIEKKSEEPEPEAVEEPEPVEEPVAVEEPEVIPEPEPEPEPEEEYVSPLEQMHSFDEETNSALSDINELLASMGIEPIEGLGKKEEPEKQIEEVMNEDTKVIAERTRRIVLEKAEKKNSASSAPAVADNGQLLLDGYADENPEVVDEKQVEEDLKNKRKSLIENFHVFSKPNVSDSPIIEEETEGTSNIVDDVELEDGEGVFEAIERTSRKNKSFFGAVNRREQKRMEEEHVVSVSEMKKKLAVDISRLGVTTIILLVLTAIMGVLAFLPTIYGGEGTALEPLLGNGGRIYTLINIIIYAVCVAFSFGSFKKGFISTIHRNFDSKSVFVFANIVVSLQMFITLCAGMNENTEFVLYGFVGAMTMLAEAYGEKKNCTSLSQTLSTLTKSELRGIQPIESKEDSAALGYDLSGNGEPSIYYSTDAKLPKNVAGLAKETSFEGKLTHTGIVISCIAGIVISVIMCIIHGNAYPLYSSLPCAVLLMLPVFRPYILALFKSVANKGSIVNGVAVLSYDECDEIARANAVVFDSSELLNVNVSAFKKAGKAKIARSDTVVYTAAVLKASDSLLAGCFDDFLKETGIKLPEVTEFQYEEGLGFFGCVGGVRVIVGNRKCMELHSIQCPTEEQEKRYCSDGIVIYTSTQEQIVSSFIVRYGARRNIRKQIEAMHRTGIVVMLRCTEPSLNDEKVADILGCSIAMVKIASSRGNEIVKDARKNLDIYSDNGILCSKRKNSLLYAISAGCALSSQRKHSKAAQFALSIVWVILFAFLAVFKVSIAFAPITVAVFEAVAAALSYFFCKLGNR